jgi:hypothetical protein
MKSKINRTVQRDFEHPLSNVESLEHLLNERGLLKDQISTIKAAYHQRLLSRQDFYRTFERMSFQLMDLDRQIRTLYPRQNSALSLPEERKL